MKHVFATEMLPSFSPVNVVTLAHCALHCLIVFKSTPRDRSVSGADPIHAGLVIRPDVSRDAAGKKGHREARPKSSGKDSRHAPLVRHNTKKPRKGKKKRPQHNKYIFMKKDWDPSGSFTSSRNIYIKRKGRNRYIRPPPPKKEEYWYKKREQLRLVQVSPTAANISSLFFGGPSSEFLKAWAISWPPHGSVCFFFACWAGRKFGAMERWTSESKSHDSSPSEAAREASPVWITSAPWPK